MISLIIIVILGMILHLLGALMEASQIHGSPIPLSKFVKERPYRILFSIVSSAVAFMLLHHDLLRQLEMHMYMTAYAMALTIGYSADSIVNKAVDITQYKVQVNYDKSNDN